MRANLPMLAGMLLLLIARSSLADHYHVPSGSMEQTLLPGDRVFVDKRAYGVRFPFTDVKIVEGRAPARGEIVVFDSPQDGKRLIKRVVAVAGDSVTLRSGHLCLNGIPASSSFPAAVERFGEREARLNLRFGGGPDVGPIHVPDGHVFVLGDSRGNSHDSRWFGFIREDSVYAQAQRVYYRSDEGFVWLPL
jgi:signal peptidase I